MKRPIRSTRGLVVAATCAILTLTSPMIATAASLAPTFLINYDATSQYMVSDIAIFQSDGSKITTTNSFTANIGETLITNPFPETSIPNVDFLLGVATNLASDGGDGQQHLVLFSNDTFAAAAQNIAFGTLFPNTDESSLINALEVIAQVVPGNTDTAYGDLGNFQGGDAQSGPNGSVAFATGDTFSEIAFSGGQIIGTGASFATLDSPGSISAAPEPSTWLLMIAGIGGIGMMLRRAKRHMGLGSSTSVAG